MRSFVIVAVLVAVGVANGLPATSVQESPVKGNAFWKGTPMDAVVSELQAGCASDDAVACVKYRVLSVLDHVLRKDSFQVTDSVSVVRNSYEEESTGRSEDGGDLVDTATRYIQRHDVNVKLPWGAQVSVSPRALDQDKLDISLDFGSSDNSVEEEQGAEARHRKYRKSKGKLRRMMVPLLVFLLLKAMTLIPLALGVLGLKAWNALQLGFFSFVIALSLAVFQLCKKIAADQAPVSQLSAHVAPWDAHYAAARALELPQAQAAAEAVQSVPRGVLPAQPVYAGDAQSLAYRGQH
ncbi:Proton extrusion protein PcxA [Frankliniella fusca]|uniref:Proton extrusion protein PcxA n=1 Tax=Frankliniella fusca TaxID=407009 RepID=A0AAE1LGH4_9NEOP|nr:Proton extrusion protein PcxA [Frankliniella fusca]